MLRFALIAALLGTCLTAAAQAATPPLGGSGVTAAPIASVKVSSCSRFDRSAVFYARMRRLERGQRMWMRFTLLERGADGTFAAVQAPGLSRWRKSKPGVRAFGYRQRVRGLADSVYRARVEYRWYSSDGQVEQRMRRRSGVCDQAGPLPNLRARVSGSSDPAVPGPRRYTVRVANAGTAAAENVPVRFEVDGASAESKTVPRVPAGGAAFVSFQAPPCLTGVTAEADPGATLRESNESDNAQRLACADVPR